jgi:hypothetical protein
MAKTTRLSIRLSEDERRQIHDVVRRLGFEGPSALVRCAIHNELTGRDAASTESEERVPDHSGRVGLRAAGRQFGEYFPGIVQRCFPDRLVWKENTD